MASRAGACYNGEDRNFKNLGICRGRRIGPDDVTEQVWLAAGLPWVSRTAEPFRLQSYWDDPVFVAVCQTCLEKRIGRALTAADLQRAQ